jgi:GNAT superfamily N-acetyltransferase
MTRKVSEKLKSPSLETRPDARRLIVGSLKRQLKHHFSVELADASKVPQILEFIHGVRKEFGFPVRNDSDLENLDAVFGTDINLIICIERDGKLVGTFGLKRISASVVEFCKIYLAKNCRGSGLGSFLLDFFIQVVTDLGYLEARLETHRNFERANHWYERVGFRFANLPDAKIHPEAAWMVYEIDGDSR